MNTTETVRVAVNEANLVRNLKFAFSNYSTFLAELIQNSRRAGATKVDIDLDGQTLTVSDDGNGIENFQSLLTIGDSGWDNQTQSLENPFGMGFTSALFACTHLMVESRGQKIAGSASALLAREDVTVTAGSVSTGTRLTLEGLTFDETKIEPALKHIASGYAIPIIFNGEKLARPYALNKDRFDQTATGWISIPDICSVKTGPTEMLVYLQGILVYGTLPRNYKPVIVHLDSTQFAAKMPDRNCLIDADEKIQEIRQSVGALVHAKLVREQKELSAEEFANRYWNTSLEFAPDVLRDHPVVPASLFVKLFQLLCSAYWFEPSERPRDLGLVTRDAYNKGDLKIVRGSDNVYLEDDPLSAVKLAYVKAHGGLIIPDNMLPLGHWLLNAPDLDLDALDVHYKILNEGVVAGSDCLALQFSIRLCEAIEIKGPWGTVVIDDMEIAIGVDGIDGVGTEACLYVPAKTMALGGGVLQFESFSFDDRHDEMAQDEAIRQYRRWINQARNMGPVALLNDLLSTVRVDVVSARGARFILDVSETGSLKVVELVDSAEA